MLRVNGRLEDGSGVRPPGCEMTALVSLLLRVRPGPSLGPASRLNLQPSPSIGVNAPYRYARSWTICVMLNPEQRCFALPKTTTAWRVRKPSD